MFNELINFLTGNDEDTQKEQIKREMPVVVNPKVTVLPKEKSLGEMYQDQLSQALTDAKSQMKEFMDNLPEERFSSGYLQEEYNGIKPKLESVIVPARVCAQGTITSLTRTGSIYENEKETLILEAKRIFKNLSDSILNSMFIDIKLALTDLMSKYDVNASRFEFNKQYSFYWTTDLVSYKLPQHGSSYTFRVTPNTLETVVVSIFTAIQTELSDFLINKHVDVTDKIMNDFFVNYANHIRAYIYDTMVELVRVSKLVIGGLYREGIDYYSYEDRQFVPACFADE